MNTHSIPTWLWLWIPIGVFVIQMGLDTVLPPDTKAWMYNENGPYEIGQVIVLVAAIVVALQILKRIDKTLKPIIAWVALALVCCIYVAGEEISWGQQILKWNTPEYWAAINDQNETNLHNTTSWLDQKPRLLLELGVYFGGIILPLLRKYKSSWVPVKFEPIYPGAAVIVTASVCLCVRFADMVGDATGNPVFGRAAEVEEAYLYYFVLLYLMELKGRYARWKGV